jgi:glycosyltransferase involved in cell wall biosynthesis
MEGLGIYSNEILRRLVLLNPHTKFIFVFDRKFSKDFIYAKNVIPVVLYPPTRHIKLFKFWFDYGIPYLAKKYKADLFFSPDGFLSKRLNIPQVNVIHDINFFHVPELLPYKVAEFYNNNFPIFAQLSSHIITVSDYTKKDVVFNYGVNENKVTGILNGVSSNYTNGTELNIAITRNEYTDTEEGFYLYVGALHSRKNVDFLLKSFDSYKSKTNSSRKLIIVGKKMFSNSDIEKAYEIMTHKNDVVFSGYIEQAKLVKLYQSAHVLIMPSLFEGFGFPVAESICCNVPVLSSNATCLPEVGGNAALYFNPKDSEDFCNKLIELEQAEVYQKLQKACEIEKKRFSWEANVRKVSEILSKCLS